MNAIQFPSDQDASGRQLGEEEIALLTQSIESGTLTATKGQFTKAFQTRFGEMLGATHSYACSSGTAAIHAAISAVDPEPGDEIITSPITDMGAITPILYQTAIPVFADVDAHSGNVTAETIRREISPRTKAVIVTHLFGHPANMDAICALAREHNIIVIEDCAQAYGATLDGKHVGLLGDIGCFSLQQGKHITTGEGGVVVTNSDQLGRRLRLFIDKAWGYGDPKPDHYFAALNSRMSELQGAVALAQLDKLDASITTRQDNADRLSAALDGTPGIETPQLADGAVCGYWRYPLIVSEHVGGPGKVAEGLREYGIMSAPRYIQKPAFECAVIRDQQTFGTSRFPFNLARPEAVDYAEERFPGTYAFLRDVLVLPWNERYEAAHVDHLAERCRAVLSSMQTTEAAE